MAGWEGAEQFEVSVRGVVLWWPRVCPGEPPAPEMLRRKHRAVSREAAQRRCAPALGG